MRLMHSGHGDGRAGPADGESGSDRSRDAGGAFRQRVPLRRLPADRRGGTHRGREGCAMNPTIGISAPRAGGYERVTGRQLFIGDIRLDKMAHVKLVTVDCARARIHAVNGKPALALPGVIAVVTADDLPSPMPRFGPVFNDRPVLAIEETKFHGEAAAPGGAPDEEAAERGGGRVEGRDEEVPAGPTGVSARGEGVAARQNTALWSGR